MTRRNTGERRRDRGEPEISSISSDMKFSFLRIWDYPVKEQYSSILTSIENAQPLPNASEGFRLVNDQHNSNFAFIHDSREIKYEITRFEFLLSIDFKVFHSEISTGTVISLLSEIYLVNNHMLSPCNKVHIYR